jgi:hypothetical protein
MHRVRQNFVLIVLLLLNPLVHSNQDIDVEDLLDRQVEEQSDISSYLESISSAPLNVNKASAQQLASIPWLSPIVAIRIVQYRYEHGDFKSLDEINKVKGVKKVYRKISPFLTKGKKPLSWPIKIDARHRILSKLEASKAIRQHKYAGSNIKLYQRFHVSISDYVRIGVLMEKDAGEKMPHDLLVGHLCIGLPIEHTQVILGHFTPELGQGLVFAGPYKLRKAADPLAPAKFRARGLVPYVFSAENSAFNGIGLSLRTKSFALHAFSSRQRRDARIENNQVISRPNTGLHRTEYEISIKKKLREQVHGLAFDKSLGRYSRIGVVWQKAGYEHKFAQKKDASRWSFSGDQNQIWGVNYDIVLGSVSSYGEAAQCASGGRALLVGGWIDLTPIEFTLVYRHYDKKYDNFYSQGFGEFSSTQNEHGFYFGMKYDITERTAACFYLDQWSFDWPKTFVPMPGVGADLLLSLEHSFSPQFTAMLRCCTQKKDDALPRADEFGNVLHIINQPKKSNLRFQIDCEVNKSLKLRSRFEMSMFGGANHDDTAGFLIYQDIRWQAHRACRLQMRWTFFDAPLYQLRFFQFENDVPGAMRLKMLNGRGKRWYILCFLKIKDQLRLCVKFENTYYDDKDHIGSGADVIDSQFENMISCQLDWTFEPH